MLKRKIVALAASASVAGGFSTASQAATPHTAQMCSVQTAAAAAPQAVASDPTIEETAKALRDLTGEQNVTVVAGKSYTGYPMHFGMVIDGENQATFWVRRGFHWTTNPDQGPMPLPASIDTCDLSVVGAFITGVTFPVFVVWGRFSVDGGANSLAVGYHEGLNSWGQLLRQEDQLLVSSRYSKPPHREGLEIGISVADGTLVTSSLWSSSSNATTEEQLADPIVRTWTGDGHEVLTMRSETGGPLD